MGAIGVLCSAIVIIVNLAIFHPFDAPAPYYLTDKAGKEAKITSKQLTVNKLPSKEIKQFKTPVITVTVDKDGKEKYVIADINARQDDPQFVDAGSWLTSTQKRYIDVAVERKNQFVVLNVKDGKVTMENLMEKGNYGRFIDHYTDIFLWLIATVVLIFLAVIGGLGAYMWFLDKRDKKREAVEYQKAHSAWKL